MGVPLILAATITVAFEGLMMFQGTGGGMKHVVIVNALDHFHCNPRIVIERKNADGVYQEVQRIDLFPGDVISVGTPGEVTTTDLYRAHVPQIGRFIVKGRVRDEVIQGIPTGGILAVMRLPAGKLSPWRTFEEQVEIIQNDYNPSTHCLSRFVVLQSEIALPGAQLRVSGGTNPPAAAGCDARKPQRLDSPFNLQDGDLIFVSNISTEDQHLHFPAYERLLVDGGRLGRVRRLREERCPSHIGERTLDRAIEEALDSHRPTPLGDCGQPQNGG